MSPRPDHTWKPNAQDRIRFSTQAEISVVEEALGALVAANHLELALDLFKRMRLVFEHAVAAQAMASQALELGDPDLYLSLLRTSVGMQEVRPEPLRSWGEERQLMRLIPNLPREAGAERSFRWLRTALLAARFEGLEEVWQHLLDFMPLLRAFPAGTAGRIRERLLAIEALSAGSASAE